VEGIAAAEVLSACSVFCPTQERLLHLVRVFRTFGRGVVLHQSSSCKKARLKSKVGTEQTRRAGCFKVAKVIAENNEMVLLDSNQLPELDRFIPGK